MQQEKKPAQTQRTVLFTVLSFLSLFVNLFAVKSQVYSFQNFNQGNTPVFTSNAFKAVGLGKGGYIYAGTANSGIYKYNGAAWIKMNVLLNNNISDIQTDKNGGIWIAQYGYNGAQATTGGMNYLPDSTNDGFDFFSASGGLPSRNCRSVWVDTTRLSGAGLPRVWSANMAQVTAGTSASGGIGLGLNGSSPFFSKITQGIDVAGGTGGTQTIGGNANEVWAFASVNFGQNQLLSYSAADGAFIAAYDNTTVPVLPAGFTGKAIYGDNAGRIWIGLTTGGVVVKQSVVWTTVNMPERFPAGTIINNNAISGDRQGNVYIGTTNGLVIYKGGTLTDTNCYVRLTTADGLPSNNVTDICIDNNTGKIIVATDNGIAFGSKPQAAVKLINPYPSLVNEDGSLKNTVIGLDTTRILKGVATDGVSKIILYLRAGQPFQFKIDDPDSTKGKLSYIFNENSRFDSVIAIPEDSMIGVIYHAPDGYGTQYPVAGGRDVTISLKGIDDSTVRLTATVHLVTPPVVLVHGMWSKPAVWHEGGFIQSLLAAGYTNVHPADFEANNFRTFDPGSAESLFGRSAVHQAIKNGLQQYEGEGIFAAQADVVGHSLGGLMTRSFSQWENVNLSKRNFKEGYVHKLITLGTPHFGSPLGPLLYNMNESIRIGEVIAPLDWAANQFIGHIGSCHRDFNPDILNNPALQNLTQTTHIKKVHAVIGLIGTGNIPFGWTNMCRTFFLQTADEIFSLNEHDLIVGRKSQLGGLDPASPYVSVFQGTGHSGPAPVTETNNPPVQEKVKLLLQTMDKAAFAGSFPSPLSAGLRTTSNQTAGTRNNARPVSITSTGSEKIRITQASRNQALNAGSATTITIAYDTLGGARINDAVLLVKELGMFAIPTTSPFSVTVNVPANFSVLGKIPYAIIARDASGVLLGDSAFFTVLPAGSFVSLKVTPTAITLDSTTREAALEPSVLYNNGSGTLSYIVKDSSAGVRYQSANNHVSVNGQGVVQAKTPGLDTVTVTYNSQTVKVPVVVAPDFALASKTASSIQFSISNKTLNYPPFALNGKASSGEDVQYQVISGPVSISNNIVTINGSGTATIRATAGANAYYHAAAPVDRTFSIIASTAVFTFTGNGNWDNPANWSNNIVPPANLPDGFTIIINPAVNGECVLNVAQSISKNAVFTINAGAKFRILGGLKINKTD
jgi:hypothetical protein